MEGTEQLHRIACPPCKIEGLPKEIFVLPESLGEYDQVRKALQEKGEAESCALMVALRARDAAGKLLFGRGILPQWLKEHGTIPRTWLVRVATAIAIFDNEWEAEQGN